VKKGKKCFEAGKARSGALMREIIEKVISCEDEGRKMIEKAQQEAVGIVAQANTRAEQVMRSNLEKLKVMAQQKRDESGKIFTGEKEKILAECRQKSAGQHQARVKDIPKIADQVFAEIMKVED
jgi:vacuolar-type H+-ATPase subunit H